MRRGWTSERRKGFLTPALGSECRLRVYLNSCPRGLPFDVEEEASGSSAMTASSYPRTKQTVLQLPLEELVLLRVGEGQCDVIEGCLEGMKAGEICEFQVMPANKDSVPKLPDGIPESWRTTGEHLPLLTMTYTLQLISFTPGKESWEMTPGEKWTWVKAHKNRGGQRFGKGDLWGACDSYCRAMKLLISLTERRKSPKMESLKEDNEEQEDSDTSSATATAEDQIKELCAAEQTPAPTEEEYVSLKAELHSNLALCQLKLNQPAKSRSSSLDATQLDPASTKAWYRLGQASLLMGELEKARQSFGKVLELQPSSTSARQALAQVTLKEKEVDSKLSQRLSKMFT